LTLHETGLSDHCLLRWNACLPKPRLTYVSSTYRPWKHLNKENFQISLLNSPLCDPDFWSDLDVDQLAALYDSTITSILDKLLPLKTSCRPVRPSDPWFDEDCRRMKSSSRWLERFFRVLSSIDSPLRLTAKSAWRGCLREYRALLRKKRADYWRTKIDSEKRSPSCLWRSFNSLLSRGRPPAHASISASLLSDFFISKVSNVRSATSEAHAPVFIPAPQDCHKSSFHPLSDADIISFIQRLPNKFSECDPLPTYLLKDSAFLLIKFLTELFNRCLSQGIFPSTWKMTLLRPIPKRGCSDLQSLSSYRPIAMLPILSKLLEKCVATQLWNHISKFDLLPNEQSGYRRNHSTETALLKVLSDLHTAMDQGRVSLLAALDLTAAFDSVDHNTLLQRLHISFGLSGTVLDWFSSFLHSRSTRVSHNHCISTALPMEYGVPQGSVLGPILFLVYISDIASIVKLHNINVHLFADDILLYHSAQSESASILGENISACIDSISLYLSSNRLLLNSSKTQVMWCFSPRCRLPPSAQIRVCNNIISPSTTIKYLGFHIDRHLSLNINITKTVSTCFSVLRRVRSIRNCLTASATHTLVTSLVLSRLDYAITSHCGAPAYALKRLQSVIHASARLVKDAKRYDHISSHLRDLNWLPVQGRIVKRTATLVHKCLRALCPQYLGDLITKVSAHNSRRTLRSSQSTLLCVPFVRRPSFGMRSFSVFAPRTWNSLPANLRDSESFNVFSEMLDTHLKEIFL
jgi:hypothetical protein